MKNHEYRCETASVLQIETRKDDDGKNRLRGYAAMFDRMSENLGGFRERIQRGAFQRSLDEGADVRSLWNHNSQYVLGRTRSGTLKLTEDEDGLRVDIDPPDTAWARDLMTSVERGDVNQMSFGFRVRVDGDKWDEDEEGRIIRTLMDVELLEVSPVTFPAYPDTTIASRSLEQWRQQFLGVTPGIRRRRMEHALRMRNIHR